MIWPLTYLLLHILDLMTTPNADQLSQDSLRWMFVFVWRRRHSCSHCVFEPAMTAAATAVVVAVVAAAAANKIVAIDEQYPTCCSGMIAQAAKAQVLHASTALSMRVLPEGRRRDQDSFVALAVQLLPSMIRTSRDRDA